MNDSFRDLTTSNYRQENNLNLHFYHEVDDISSSDIEDDDDIGDVIEDVVANFNVNEGEECFK